MTAAGCDEFTLRGRTNILKRLVVHAGTANLGLLMRKLFGVGTPRALQSRIRSVFSLITVPQTGDPTARAPDNIRVRPVSESVRDSRGGILRSSRRLKMPVTPRGWLEKIIARLENRTTPPVEA